MSNYRKAVKEKHIPNNKKISPLLMLFIAILLIVVYLSPGNIAQAQDKNHAPESSIENHPDVPTLPVSCFAEAELY